MPDPLILNCGSGAALSSSYLFVYLSIQRVQLPTTDPSVFLATNGSVGVPVTDPAAIALWTAGPACDAPADGTWDPDATYALGQTVGSAGVPWTYRSLHNSNKGHPPQSGGIETMDGWWTNVCQPPQVANQLLAKSGFGYVFTDALPDITGMTWQANNGGTTFWDVDIPGDIYYLYDVGVRLNFTDFTTADLRAQAFLKTDGSEGVIIAPSTSSGKFCTWHTSGVSSPPILQLFGWPAIPKDFDGTPAVGDSYSTTMVPAGGTGPYTFDLIAGALPRGLSLDDVTGAISGTLLEVGTFSYTIRVTDSLGATATVTCGIGVGCKSSTGNSGY